MIKSLACLYTFLLLFFTISVFAQNNPEQIINAQRISSKPIIDANINDDAWSNINVITNFTQFEPNPNTKPSYPTELKVAYDDEALYLSAFMKDEYPDSIPKQQGYRDAIGANADYICLFIDTYNDGQNGYGFCLSVSNIQSDSRYSPSEGENWNWNAIWFSKTKIADDGWYAEMRIPYSSIRFPKKEIQTWGINFWRNFRRARERSSWAPFDTQGEGFVNQWGKFQGIKGIDPPVRLSLTPYFSTAYDRYYDKTEPPASISTTIRGGADIKYGLNESFTLDMTLIPDFGQTQSDDQVLNLSPFEVRFDENRSFFLEGTDLFNKGGLFYSRRIGGRPLNYWDIVDQEDEGELEIIDNPSTVQMINATKISGRTKDGTGLGFFNAVTSATMATVKRSDDSQEQILTNPLTNYNVLVYDRPLKNNSYFSLVNTNVLRENTYRDANASSFRFDLKNKNSKYGVRGGVNYTQLFDKDHEHSDEIEDGLQYNLSVGKVSGNFQLRLGYWVETDTYNPNDIGFLFNNNERNISINGSYEKNESFSIFNSTWNYFGIHYNMLYEPSTFTGLNVWFNNIFTFKNFITTGLNWGFIPTGSYDYFEPRVDGRYWYEYPGGFVNWFLSSDYRKKLAIDFGGGTYIEPKTNVYTWDYFVNPIWRVNDRIRIEDSFSYDFSKTIGYTDELEDGTILFARRAIDTYVNRLDVSYIFNSKMALTFRNRYYWRKVVPVEYRQLELDGETTPITGIEDDYVNSANFFNIDLLYRWEFSPGSELSVGWKNFIFQGDEIAEDGYAENFRKTLEAPQNNNFSLKVVYYLDYLYLKRLTGNNNKKDDSAAKRFNRAKYKI